MPTKSQPPTEARIREIIASTDWTHYDLRVNFHNQKPHCPPYDGNYLCGHWSSWIIQGRALYPDTPEGESAYIAELQEAEPRLKINDLRRTLSN